MFIVIKCKSMSSIVPWINIKQQVINYPLKALLMGGSLSTLN